MTGSSLLPWRGLAEPSPAGRRNQGSGAPFPFPLLDRGAEVNPRDKKDRAAENRPPSPGEITQTRRPLPGEGTHQGCPYDTVATARPPA